MNLHGILMDLAGQVASGVHPDKHHVGDYLWQTANNVRFTANGFKPIGGWYSDMTEQPLAPSLRGGGWWRTVGDMTGFIGNWNTLYSITTAIDSPATTIVEIEDDLTGIRFEDEGVPATFWTVAPWGTWRIISNGVDHCSAWEPGVGNTDLDIPSPPRILLTQSPHVLGFNFAAAPNRFAWCSADDVEEWTTAPDNTAGDLDVREFSNGIIAAVPLGEAIAIYSDNQMGIVNYLGAPFVYGYEITIPEGVGAYSAQSVFSVGRMNYGVCRNGFFRTDGVNYDLIGQEEVWETFKGELNPGQTSLIHGYHLEAESELWWWYPVGTGETEPTRAIVYNYKHKTWTFSDTTRSGSIAPTDLQYPLAFDPDGSVYFQEYGLQEVRTDYVDGPLQNIPIAAFVESKSLVLNQVGADGKTISAEQKYKYIQAILLHVVRYSDMGLMVRVGVQDEWQDAPTFWSEPFPDNLVFPMVSGKYIKIRIEASTTRTGWEVQGMTIHGKILGNVR